MGRDIEAGELLWEAYKRLLPAAANVVSPQAGLAASVAVFTTWLLRRKSRGGRGWRLEDDEKRAVLLASEVERRRARLRALEKARERAARAGRDTATITAVIESEREVLEALETELELVQLRIQAMRLVKALGDKRLVEDVRRLVEKAEQGEGFEEEQLRVLRSLEEKWRSRELEAAALKQLLLARSQAHLLA